MTKEEQNKMLTHIADWQLSLAPDVQDDLLRLVRTIKCAVLDEVYEYIESIEVEDDKGKTNGTIGKL